MTRRLSVLVVDDEAPARRQVARFLREDPRFELVGEACDGIEALEQIETLAPAVVVLDIQMPGLDGFEVLAALGDNARFAVVFSTAFDAHALRAFQAHAVDYLLKPYDAASLLRALEKAYAQWVHAAGVEAHDPYRRLIATGRSPASTRLTVRNHDGAWLALEPDEIVRLVAANKRCRIHLRDSEHLVRMSLSELAERLDARFVQVHRSEYVNLHAVQRLEPWSHGDSILVLDDGSTVVLTRTYRDAFLIRFLPAP